MVQVHLGFPVRLSGCISINTARSDDHLVDAYVMHVSLRLQAPMERPSWWCWASSGSALESNGASYFSVPVLRTLLIVENLEGCTVCIAPTGLMYCGMSAVARWNAAAPSSS